MQLWKRVRGRRAARGASEPEHYAIPTACSGMRRIASGTDRFIQAAEEQVALGLLDEAGYQAALRGPLGQRLCLLRRL